MNGVTAANVDELFARNERLVSLFASRHGQFASVMVGAMIVAGIETVFGGPVETHAPQRVDTRFERGEHVLEAGAEMGRFILGSTVVLLFEPGQVRWRQGLGAGDSVRMGEAIGSWI